MEVLSKGDFAGAIGVTAGRVSQMIAAGIIGPEALDGEGRMARIRVDIARRQIAQRRHPGQALGNGLLTRVADAPEAPAADTPAPADGQNLAAQLQQQRLEAEQRKNRIAARDEAASNGQLVPADQVRAEMGRALQAMEDENAGMLADFAAAIAAGIADESLKTQRDVLHCLRRIRTDKRAQAADRARARAQAAPETLPATVGELA